MFGKRNGVAVQLRVEVPHLLEQHCVAHKEDFEGLMMLGERCP